MTTHPRSLVHSRPSRIQAFYWLSFNNSPSLGFSAGSTALKQQQCGISTGDLGASRQRCGRSTAGVHHSWQSQSHSSGRGIEGQHYEDEVLNEMSVLVGDTVKLKEAVNISNRGIGPEMRERVNRLHDRATMLKQSAERAVKGAGRVPVQLTATFKALQREHSSLENIVRLAVKAGPVLSDSEFSQPLGNERKETSLIKTNEAGSVALEDGETKPVPFQSLQLESAVVPANELKYVMTTPAGQGSSPLAAFRSEIERRVMEQLVRKQRSSVFVPMNGISERSTSLNHENQQPETSKKRSTSDEHRSREALDELISEKAGSSREAEKSGGRQPVREKDLFLRVVKAERKARIAETDAALKSLELERLKNQLDETQREVKDWRQETTRADSAEAQVRKLEIEIAKNVPLEVHEQTVRRVRDALLEARARVSQITGEVKEKEAILDAVKKELLAEREQLLEKVRKLTGEVSKRVSLEEMEAAVNNAVAEIGNELEKAKKKAVMVTIELERKERSIGKLQEEWRKEKEGLELENVRLTNRVANMQKERMNDMAQLIEAQQKVKLLEDEILQLKQHVKDAEAHKELQRQALLDNVRTFVAEMVKTTRAKPASDAKAANLLESMPMFEQHKQRFEIKRKEINEKVDISGVKQEVTDIQEALLSGERAASLEKFFAIMGQLIRQESEKLNATSANIQQHSFNRNSESADTFFESENYQSDLQSINALCQDGQEREALQTLKTIILQYESSWETAYIHYSADNSAWTKPPGILMLNDIGARGKSMKIIQIPATTLEFVLTDGNDTWDHDPAGGNYFIKQPGSFVLSSGVLKSTAGFTRYRDQRCIALLLHELRQHRRRLLQSGCGVVRSHTSITSFFQQKKIDQSRMQWMRQVQRDLFGSARAT